MFHVRRKYDVHADRWRGCRTYRQFCRTVLDHIGSKTDFFPWCKSITEEIPKMRLVAEDLTVSRADRIFFRGLGFQVGQGEALLVTGPNGIGKSTLLRMVAGLLPVMAGRIALENDTDRSVGEASHYLGHRNAMKHDMSVAENLTFWQRFMQGDGPAGRMTLFEATETLGLDGLEHLPFGYLSAGQQRRMAMARLLMVHRPVWILDEPTAALDAASTQLFAGLVERHLADGGMMIAATHQPLGLEATHTLTLDPDDRAVEALPDPFAPDPFAEDGAS